MCRYFDVTGNLLFILKQDFGVKICDVKFDANNNSVKLSATSAPHLHRRKGLSANYTSVVPCDLDANNDGAKLRVYLLKAFRQRHI
jgi:hypothetical protein